MPAGLKSNPWLKIWVDPRNTIREIVDFNPKYMFIVLSGFYGFPMLLHLAQTFSLGQIWPLPLIIVVAFLLSVFIGMLGITIASGLLLWTGKWIGGRASYQEIRAAVAWSNVTNGVNVLLWVLLIGIFRSALFSDAFTQTNFVGPQLAAVMFVYLLQLVLAVWSLVILFKSLGEVQGFSAWKAVLNVVIPFIMVVVGVWILLWIAWWLTGMPQ